MKSYLFIFIISLLSGCKQILLISYGIKDPKYESEKSITNFCLKYDLHAFNVYTVDSTTLLNYYMNDIGIPDIAVYDKNGNYIPYRNMDQCNGKADGFLELACSDTLNLIGGQKADSIKGVAPYLKDELKKMYLLNGKYAYLNSGNEDFTVLIFFTVYTGKLNKIKVKEWEDIAYAQSCNIRVIKVNIDWQQWWSGNTGKALNFNYSDAEAK